MSEFKSHHIVPDVIDTWPPTVCQVEYDSKTVVSTGNHLPVSRTQNNPSRIYWEHTKQPNDYYTLMMVDPDAPNPKTHEFRHWLHWLVINIPGTAERGDHMDVHKGHTVATYKGPAPPPGTGPHRYVFLVYHQPGQADQLKVRSITERKNFNISEWLNQTFPAAKGQPKPELVAANFFSAEHGK